MDEIFDIPKHWLRWSGTPEEAEQARLESMASGFNVPLEKIIKRFGDRPFGRLTAKWRGFVEQMQEGDELWFFTSPDETWSKKCGRAGYAIIRDGTVRAKLVTVRN